MEEKDKFISNPFQNHHQRMSARRDPTGRALTAHSDGHSDACWASYLSPLYFLKSISPSFNLANNISPQKNYLYHSHTYLQRYKNTRCNCLWNCSLRVFSKIIIICLFFITKYANSSHMYLPCFHSIRPESGRRMILQEQMDKNLSEILQNRAAASKEAKSFNFS